MTPHRITIDMKKSGYKQFVNIRQAENESHILYISLTNGTEPIKLDNDMVATVYLEGFSKQWESCDIVDNEIVFTAPILNVGDTKCQIQLSNNSGYSISPTFIFVVENILNVPHFELLEEEPDDWVDNADSYYTFNGIDYIPVKFNSDRNLLNNLEFKTNDHSAGSTVYKRSQAISVSQERRIYCTTTSNMLSITLKFEYKIGDKLSGNIITKVIDCKKQMPIVTPTITKRQYLENGYTDVVMYAIADSQYMDENNKLTNTILEYDERTYINCNTPYFEKGKYYAMVNDYGNVGNSYNALIQALQEARTYYNKAIKDVSMIDNCLVITYNDNTQYKSGDLKGDGIARLDKSTEGNVDTYTFVTDKGNTFSFTVTNADNTKIEDLYTQLGHKTPLDVFNKEVANLKELINNLDTKKESIEEHNKFVSHLKSSLSIINTQLSALNNNKVEKDTYSTAIESLQSLVTKLQNSKVDTNTYNDEIANLQGLISDIKDKVVDKNALDTAISNLDSKKVDIVDYNLHKEHVANELSNKDEELANLLGKTSSNENRIAVAENSLKTFSTTNIINDYNSNKVGYFSSVNANNQGSYTDGEYLLSTSTDNTDRAKWVFDSERQLPPNDYYIGFDYVSNTDFNLGVKIDNNYKDLGKIGAITDGNKHTFVTTVTVANSLNLYEVYLPDKANLNCRITNFFVKSKEDYVKTFNSIEEFVSQHTLYEITPEKFGAVGNGQFDDTTALQKAIDYCVENGTQLKCQNGKTYCISSPLNLSNTSTCLIDFNWAVLKAIKTMDYMITFDGSANAKNDVKTLLKNIIIDCNNKAGGLNLIYSYKFTFENFMIKNCQTVAICIQRGGAFICQNGTIIGDCTPDSRGIYNQTSDCHFNEIVIVDMKKCIYNGGTNFYNKVHGWLTSKVANSIFFTHFAGFGSLTQCQCDTYETGYLLRTSYDLSLVACTYYNNYHLYDSEVTPVVFKFNSGIRPYARRICCTNCSFNSPNLQTTLSSVVDAQITFNGYTHFINIDGYSTIGRISPTLQAKVTSDFDGSVNKLTYRNGLCYYDFSLQFTSTIGASNLLEIATIQSPYYPLENQMFPCYLTKTLAGSDCIVGKLLIGTDGKVQVRVPSGSVADYQYLYAHCYYEPKAIGE